MDKLIAMLKALDDVLLDGEIDDNGKVAYAINALDAILPRAVHLSEKAKKKS